MLKTSNSEIKKGFASEYKWDGLSVDGSGKTMKDDPRVVIDERRPARCHIRQLYRL